jgi:hypothetical protein
MKIKNIILMLSAFMVCFFKAQSVKLVEIKKLGLTINLPDSFNNMNQNKKEVQYVVTNDKNQNKAKKPETEETEDIKFQGKDYTFFMVFSDKNKTSDTAIQPAIVNKKAEEFIESLKKIKTEAKFTKHITKEEIGKISFYKTSIKIDLKNNISQNYIIYNAIINGYKASFTIIYVKETSELTELLSAFRNFKIN